VSGVLLDSSGLIALWNRRDQWHAAATRAFSEIEPAAAFVTTSYILAECANTFARSDLRDRLVILADGLAAQQKLIFPSDADWHEAWNAFSHDHPNSPSLTDQLSFAVMRRLSLKRAFTNDRHFGEAGFEPLF
jgi:predicted nucleic acid-binding protein